MIDEITKVLKEAQQQRVFPGAVVGLLDRGVRQFVVAGNYTYDEASMRVREDTIYDVASITKSVPIGLLALKLAEEGKLSLDDTVTTYVSEMDMQHSEKALIWHLLTFTHVLQKDNTFSYAQATADDFFNFIYHRPFESLPGTRYEYSNAPFNLLGLIIERITGVPLYTVAQKEILQPLAMVHATFAPADKGAIPPTEIIPWRGEVQGVVHDDQAFILGREGYDSGAAGLFASADDLLNVADMILSDGLYGGSRLFSSATVALMHTNALSNVHASSGMGWELNVPRFMGRNSHERLIGKTGYTGTVIEIDPRSKRAFVLLSNRTYPTRPANGDAINTVRRAIADIVFSL